MFKNVEKELYCTLRFRWYVKVEHKKLKDWQYRKSETHDQISEIMTLDISLPNRVLQSLINLNISIADFPC